MKQKAKGKILLWFRMGAVPAMIFSALNAIGITAFAAPKNAVDAGVVVNSSIASPSSSVVKAAPISETVIEPSPTQKIDISYLTTGTSAGIYIEKRTVISVILPDGTVRELR